MRLAVMQPYIFPYIGYFQLVSAVDLFVFFNDVNFIKKGWINRNYILNQNKPQLFTVPLVKVSQNKKINEIEIFDFPTWREKFLTTLKYSYHNSIFFENVVEIIRETLFKKDYLTIDELAAQTVISVSEYIGLNTQFVFSSDLSYEGSHGQNKILDICALLEATSYINPKNGAFQYEESVFKAKRIDLLFLEAVNVEYAQYKNNTFVPWLSIIDVLMFNSKEEILAMTKKNRIYPGSTSGKIWRKPL